MRGFGLGLGLVSPRRQLSTPPVVDPNLLKPLNWIQGSNTTMTIGGGRVRAANNGGNPRAYKTITGLIQGRMYRLQGTCYPGVGGSNYFFRVSTSPDLPAGDAYQVQQVAGVNIVVDQTIEAYVTTFHIGVVGIRTEGEYVEIDDSFSMILLD